MRELGLGASERRRGLPSVTAIASVCALVASAIPLGRVGATPASAPATAVSPIAPSQFGEPLRGGGVVLGGTPHRILHFTFDDGPDAKLTPRLLDLLDQAGWKATFFFSTSRFDAKQRRNDFAPAMAREVARRGHQLGAHSYQHQHMSRLKPPELREQLDLSDAMFRRVFGTRTFLFRPPFGSRNAALDQMLADEGYVTAIWNVGMADWVAREPAMLRMTFWRVLERNEKENVERGGIVLMHDTHAWSIEAFALIAESIQARNCELLGSGDELYDVVDSMAPWIKPLSADAYTKRQQELRQRTAARCAAHR